MNSTNSHDFRRVLGRDPGARASAHHVQRMLRRTLSNSLRSSACLLPKPRRTLARGSLLLQLQLLHAGLLPVHGRDSLLPALCRACLCLTRFTRLTRGRRGRLG